MKLTGDKSWTGIACVLYMYLVFTKNTGISLRFMPHSRWQLSSTWAYSEGVGEVRGRLHSAYSSSVFSSNVTAVSGMVQDWKE